KAFTLRPGAATGRRSPSQPRAVGILRVGSRPCGFGSGMAGDEPTAWGRLPSRMERATTIVPPTHSTTFANALDIPIVMSLPPEYESLADLGGPRNPRRNGSVAPIAPADRAATFRIRTTEH